MVTCIASFGCTCRGGKAPSGGCVSRGIASLSARLCLFGLASLRPSRSPRACLVACLSGAAPLWEGGVAESLRRRRFLPHSRPAFRVGKNQPDSGCGPRAPPTCDLFDLSLIPPLCFRLFRMSLNMPFAYVFHSPCVSVPELSLSFSEYLLTVPPDRLLVYK